MKQNSNRAKGLKTVLSLRGIDPHLFSTLARANYNQTTGEFTGVATIQRICNEIQNDDLPPMQFRTVKGLLELWHYEELNGKRG